MIDRHNYHLFQPLLYQVATAALSPADIAAPIRSVLRRQANTSVMLARVTGVDTVRQEVVLGARRIPFDFLVLATGARHAYFGHDDWELHAHGIKKIDDATFLRRKILLAFERAESESDPSERRRLLTFVVIGGGATGVELAGAIAELARKALAADFRTIDPRSARVTLLEAGPRLLPAFDELSVREGETLAREARRRGSRERHGDGLRRLRRVDRRRAHRDPNHRLGRRRSRVSRREVARRRDRSRRPGKGRAGPIRARAFERVRDRRHGACARSEGQPLPGVAPVAKQQGAYAARAIEARLAGESPAPFHYRDFGSLATIGRRSAVAQLGRVHLSGYLAWWLWGLAHIYFLIGFRNRLAVAMNWAWNYVSFQRGTRLITGGDPETDAAASSAAPAALLRESA